MQHTQKPKSAATAGYEILHLTVKQHNNTVPAERAFSLSFVFNSSCSAFGEVH
jgi:hypothetical protein